MPAAKGLFDKAIQESGPIVKVVDRAAAIQTAELTLKALGVKKADVHQLQTMDRGSSTRRARCGFRPLRASL
jgi:para-nitrobenzyl esterase